MNLITVIPIAKAIGKQTLTYFSSESPSLGSVVSIPLRNKKISGIVVEIDNASQKKSEIKNLSYGMKKMDGLQSQPFLSSSFMEAVSSIADYYATTPGAVLSALLPKTILESIGSVTKLPTQQHTNLKNQIKNNITNDVVALQSPDEERFGTYKSMAREEFAKKKSVCMILPSVEEIRLVYDNVHKGIEQYTFVLHNTLSKKEILKVWQDILVCPHPVLILATGYFLSVPRSDIGVVIVESESSRAYHQPTRPYLDIRTVAEIVARHMGWKIVFGDTLLRVETIYRAKEHLITPVSPLVMRVLSYADCILSDVRTPKDQTKKEFEIIGKDVEQLIRNTQEHNDFLFLFSARKGLAPLTVCADCGETVSCPNCKAPVVLYGASTNQPQRKGNSFICHACGHSQSADVLCARCNSWKLTPLGVGIESTVREIQKKFPDVTIFVMDKDHVKTHKQAQALAKKFFDTPGSVCIGTEMALPYVRSYNNGKIGNTGVISLDSYLSIPDFRIKEKIMSIIMSLRDMALKKCVVQTRRPSESVFTYALNGNIADFYRDEIAERKRFNYPPFYTFIKISLAGQKVEVRKVMEKLRTELEPYTLNVFDALHSGGTKTHITHGLIMLPRGSYPDANLIAKLRGLSPQFAIKVDPDTLL